MVVETPIEIAAPVERVWQVLIDLSQWRHWNSVLRRVTAQGGTTLTPHLRFRCTVTVFVVPVLFEAVVTEVVDREHITWTSDWLGIHARHEFRCTPVGDRVRITSREEFRGVTTAVAGPLFPAWRVRQLTATMLRDLKRAAED